MGRCVGETWLRVRACRLTSAGKRRSVSVNLGGDSLGRRWVRTLFVSKKFVSRNCVSVNFVSSFLVYCLLFPLWFLSNSFSMSASRSTVATGLFRWWTNTSFVARYFIIPLNNNCNLSFIDNIWDVIFTYVILTYVILTLIIFVCKNLLTLVSVIVSCNVLLRRFTSFP